MSILEKQIKDYYIHKDSHNRVEQGDLLRDIEVSQIISEEKDEIKIVDCAFHHILVVSQDCDLEQFFNAQSKNKEHINAYLHNVIIFPCYYRSEIESGSCIKYIGIIQNGLSKREIEKIQNNEMERYQYIRADAKLEIPELFIDFKAYYTLSPNYLFSKYKDKYVATINVLFREKITQRYTNYISRIGLPVLN